MNSKDKATRGAHAAQALALRERPRCASDSILRNSAVGYSAVLRFAVQRSALTPDTRNLKPN